MEVERERMLWGNSREVTQVVGGGEKVLGRWLTTTELVRETAGEVLGMTSGPRKEDKEICGE